MQTSWRTAARQLLRRFRLLPILVLIVALVGLGFCILRYHSAILEAGLALTVAASSFVAGYALRMHGIWPRLHEYRRSQYAAVWDELALRPDAAAAAAAGISSENELQASGKQVVERIQAHLLGLGNLDVLEIACGVGRVGRELAPLCRSWIGCDISQNMLSHAATRMGHLKNVQFVRLAGVGLREVPNASVDAVYCTNALPHFDPMERCHYVRESYRVLRPDGRIYFDTVALDSPEGWTMLENNLGQRANFVDPPYMPIPSTPDEFLAYFTNAGFQDVRAEVAGSLLMVTGAKRP